MNYRNQKLEDKVWESFCLNDVQQKPQQLKKSVKRRFDSHPHQIESYSDSDTSCHEIHLNKNFNVVESTQDFDVGIIELNNNDLLKELYELEVARKEQFKPLKENKQTARSVRIIRSKEYVADDDKNLNEPKIEEKKLEKKQSTLMKPSSSKPKLKIQFVDKKIGDEKFKVFIEKILYSIDEIRLIMESGQVLPDGDEDAARRKKRAGEFSGRFSRMYLYQLGRHVNELQRISKTNTGKTSQRSRNFDCQQKLLTAHQLALQGFQAYQNHLPTSVPKGIPDKLKELLNSAIALCDVHRNLINCDINLVAKREDMINAFENHSKLLLEKMQEKVPTSTSLNSHSKFSLLGRKTNNGVKNIEKRKIQSRLSMYSQCPIYKSEFWKNTVSTLSKKKYSVQSRYKTSTLKHRPQPVKPIETNKPKNKLLGRHSSGSIKSYHSRQCNIDDVPTMIQMENDLNTKETSDIRNDILKPLTRSIFEQFCDENKDMTQNEFEKLLQKLLVLVRNNDQNNEVKNTDSHTNNTELENCNIETKNGIDFLKKFTKQTQNNEYTEKLETRVDRVIKETSENTKRKQTITISGAKNAQLICIRDDDSIIDEIISNKEHKEEIQLGITSETQTSFLENVNKPLSKTNENEFASKTSVKISRLPKITLRPLQVLPKEIALNVIQYKLDFNKNSKKNHMYKKNDKIQPWILTGRIADNILEHVLFSVIREIEINELLENLYQSEFL